MKIDNTSGIYKITNLKTGKFYLGSSLHIKNRFYRHKYDLRRGEHDNIYLQRSWNKYGEENFAFETVELVDSKVLKEMEQQYLDTLDRNKMYNIGNEACGGDNLTNHPNYENIIRKMTASVILRYKKMSQEEKDAYSKKVSGRNNPNYGNKWSIEQREKLSLLKTGKKLSQETRQKMSTFQKKLWKDKTYNKRMSDKRRGNGNAFFGKHHSQSTKIILAERTKERIGKMTKKEKEEWKKKISQNSSVKRKVSIEGKIYESLTEAAKALGLHHQIIYNRIHSSSERFKNYFYL